MSKSMIRIGLGAWLALAVSFTFSASRARAFAENIRHGYVNCTSCHISPTGGGALTAYGRELSRELMSTWGEEGEQKWFYVVPQPEQMGLGGDLRMAYLYRDDPAERSGKWYFMQSDVEAYGNVLAGTKQQLWIGGSLGVEKKDQNADKFDFISRRHYVNYRPADELSFRAGRFMPQYGLNVPDHIPFFRDQTGREPGTDTYNLEAAYIGDKWNAFITAIFGRPDDPSVSASYEKGAALNASYAFWDRNRAGLSYYRGDSDSKTRDLAGPYAMIGITEKLYWLSEIDWQWLSDKSSAIEQRGWATYNRVGYEVAKGLIPYAVHEYQFLNDQSWVSRGEGVGIGVQWLPRPHLELNAAWEKRRQPAAAEGFSDYAYLMLHFYP